MLKSFTDDRTQKLKQAVHLLGWLSEPGSGFTANELAKRLGVDRGTLTRTMNALRDAGFVIQSERDEERPRYRAAERVCGGLISPTPEAMAALAVAVDGLRCDGHPHTAQPDNHPIEFGFSLPRQVPALQGADIPSTVSSWVGY